MAEIGTMKDIYTVARHVGIPGEAIDRFVKTLEAAGYEVRHKVDSEAADANRYRWLRDQAQEGDWGHHYGWKLHLDIKGAPSLETLDQAIDALRGCEGDKG